MPGEEEHSVDYSLEVFLLGAASGAATVLFFLLALWFRRKDATLTLYRQSQMNYFFSKGMVGAFMMSLFCAILALSGALTLAGGALPRLAWSAGVIISIVVLLALWWIVR
ncbi:MAG TPA: hypothetical protein VFU63_14740 [Ktedonobacterales bacterium]|nr:hypothetical protein [Ktedonobacterales bacterium]